MFLTLESFHAHYLDNDMPCYKRRAGRECASLVPLPSSLPINRQPTQHPLRFLDILTPSHLLLLKPPDLRRYIQKKMRSIPNMQIIIIALLRQRLQASSIARIARGEPDLVFQTQIPSGEVARDELIAVFAEIG